MHGYDQLSSNLFFPRMLFSCRSKEKDEEGRRPDLTIQLGRMQQIQ